MHLPLPVALIFGLDVRGIAPMILYVAGVVIFLVSAFWRPRYGVYFLLPLLPLQTLRYRLHDFWLGEKFVDIILLGIILGILMKRDGDRFLKTPLNRFLILFAVFLYVLLWKGSYYLGAPSPLDFAEDRVSTWKNYLEMPLLFLLVASVIKEVRHMKIVILLMSTSFFLVARSYFNTIRDRDLSTFSYAVRDAGPLGYAGENGLAAFLVEFLIFLVAIYAFEKKVWRKLPLLGLIALGVYCMLFTFSRGGYLAFAVGITFLGLLKDRKLLIVVLAVVIGWQVLLPVSVQQRIMMTYDVEGGALDTSAQTRVDLWEDAMQLIRVNPVVGIGLDTYRFLNRVGGYADTHNYYLKVMLETGAIGLMLFLWLLWRMLGLGWRLYRSTEDPFLRSLGLGFTGMMVSAVVLNLFGDRWTYLQVNAFLWVLMGCVVRAQVIVSEAGQEAPAVTAPAGALPAPAGRPRLA